MAIQVVLAEGVRFFREGNPFGFISEEAATELESFSRQEAAVHLTPGGADHREDDDVRLVKLSDLKIAC